MKKWFFIIAVLFNMLLFYIIAEGALGPRGLNRYIDEGSVIREPVVSQNGIVITPQRWFVIKEENSSQGPVIKVEFQAENRSDSEVVITVSDLYINGQQISTPSLSVSDVKPGETVTWQLEIQEFFLDQQRIDHIRDMSVVFMIYDNEAQEGSQKIIIDPVTVATGNGNGLIACGMKQIYANEELEITAASALREFKGAYTISTNVYNKSDFIAAINSKIISINGKTVEPGSPLDIGGSALLYPGKSKDMGDIVYIKHEDNMVPLNEIKTVTWEVSGRLLKKDPSNNMPVILEKELEPITFTIEIQ